MIYNLRANFKDNKGNLFFKKQKSLCMPESQGHDKKKKSKKVFLCPKDLILATSYCLALFQLYIENSTSSVHPESR